MSYYWFMGFIVIKLSIDSETIDGHGDDGIFFFFMMRYYFSGLFFFLPKLTFLHQYKMRGLPTTTPLNSTIKQFNFHRTGLHTVGSVGPQPSHSRTSNYTKCQCQTSPLRCFGGVFFPYFTLQKKEKSPTGSLKVKSHFFTT